MQELDNINFNGHITNIVGIGWGEPRDLFGHCSCGWNGTKISETWGEDFDDSAYAEVFKPLVRKYGAKAVFTTEDETIGEYNDALVQVLHHVEYDKIDVNSMFEELERKISTLRDEFNSKDLLEITKISQNVTYLTTEIVLAQQRLKIMQETPLLKIEVNNEARAAYSRAHAELMKDRNGS